MFIDAVTMRPAECDTDRRRDSDSEAISAAGIPGERRGTRHPERAPPPRYTQPLRAMNANELRPQIIPRAGRNFGA